MREILFRGKRIDNGEWINGYLVGGNLFVYESTVICLEGVSHKAFEVEASTVGQYTNLKDRNGRRIFEGDFVAEYHPPKGSYPEWYDKPYLVSFDENRRGWYPFACGDGCGCCEVETVSPYVCDVLGNIHDNPKLMEEYE